jgi:hypothetical protein
LHNDLPIYILDLIGFLLSIRHGICICNFVLILCKAEKLKTENVTQRRAAGVANNGKKKNLKNLENRIFFIKITLQNISI